MNYLASFSMWSDLCLRGSGETLHWATCKERTSGPPACCNSPRVSWGKVPVFLTRNPCSKKDGKQIWNAVIFCLSGFLHAAEQSCLHLPGKFKCRDFYDYKKWISLSLLLTIVFTLGQSLRTSCNTDVTALLYPRGWSWRPETRWPCEGIQVLSWL